MQTSVLTKIADPDLRTYIVWVPKSRGMRRDVPTAASTVTDTRAVHYWDGDSILVSGYRDTLKLSEDAWDVFLLYGPDARWEGDRPPAPAYWAHQLGEPDRPRVGGPWLDGAVFLQRTKILLNR